MSRKAKNPAVIWVGVAATAEPGKGLFFLSTASYSHSIRNRTPFEPLWYFTLFFLLMQTVIVRFVYVVSDKFEGWKYFFAAPSAGCGWIWLRPPRVLSTVIEWEWMNGLTWPDRQAKHPSLFVGEHNFQIRSFPALVFSTRISLLPCLS